VEAGLDFEHPKTVAADLQQKSILECVGSIGCEHIKPVWDEAKLFQFLNGCREAVKLDKNKLHLLVDLMAETMIAEAVLPVAATADTLLRINCRRLSWLAIL